MSGPLGWVLWVIFLVAAAIWADQKAPTPAPTAMVAVHTLAENTLLVPGQFVPAALASTYVTRAGGIPAGQSVTLADVSTAPHFPTIPAGTVIASIPLDWAAIANGLNAGSKVALCLGPARLADGVAIQTVRCTGAGASCTAAIALPATARDAIDALGKPDSTLHVAADC